jgi:tetratricopeptide (TPR) repeat protein
VSDARFDEAIAEARRVVGMTSRSPSTLAALAQVYAATGRRSEAISTLNELLETSRSQYVSPVSVYATYFSLGDADKGFEWLEKAIEERSNGVAYVAVDSFMDRVRNDPRYLRVLERIGLQDVR